MSNRPSAKKIKKSQTLRKVVSNFIQSKSPFEPHLNVSYLAGYIKLAFFFRYAWRFEFAQFDYWQFNEINNPVIHWFDRYLIVSSLNCLQWLTGKCITDGSKYVEIRDPFCYLYIHFVWILYTNCIHDVYEVPFL